MIVSIYSGKKVTHWHEVTKVQYLETATYVLKFSNGKISTVYGRLLCVSEVKEGD